MHLIPYEEYKKRVCDYFLENYCKAFPLEQRLAYLESQEKHIRDNYENDTNPDTEWNLKRFSEGSLERKKFLNGDYLESAIAGVAMFFDLDF